MELKIYKTETGKFRWRLIDPALKGTARFIGSGNQGFKSRSAARENALAVSAGLNAAIKASAKAPAKTKAKAKSKRQPKRGKN